jgi:hypothetical protein
LRNHPALTFEQLSWPTGAQLSGADGGVYRASAQLFVNELLGLKNGRAHLRAMLETLPDCYNWQTAFQSAFRENFPRPLDVEKWWALQVVGFAARDPGPMWTPAASRDRLDEILSVPVEMRTASNALPAHAQISLQAVIRNWDRAAGCHSANQVARSGTRATAHGRAAGGLDRLERGGAKAVNLTGRNSNL